MDRILVGDVSMLSLEGLIHAVKTFPAPLSAKDQNFFLFKMLLDISLEWIELLRLATPAILTCRVPFFGKKLEEAFFSSSNIDVPAPLFRASMNL